MNWYQARRVYAQLPMKRKDTLPDESWSGFVKLRDDLPSFPCYIKGKPKAGVRWGHRVIVYCDCGKLVPFGRMNQHYKRPTCGAV